MVNKGKTLILCIGFLGLIGQVFAQDLRIFIDEEEVYSAKRSNEWVRNAKANELLSALWGKGYIFSQVVDKTDSVIWIHKGEYHDFTVRKVFYVDSSVYFHSVKTRKNAFIALNAIKTELSNRGYPFATIQLVDIKKDENGYSADISIDKGPKIIFDTVYLIKQVTTRKSYIEQALFIQRGQLYSEQSFQSIEKAISRLPFLSLNQPPDIAFENGLATVYLDLKEDNTNRFEGILGILPNQSSGDVLITGFLDLKLNNLLKTGKSFAFNWNRFASQSQAVALSYSNPLLLGSRLSFDLTFNLFKQDTTFLNQNFGLQIGSYLGDLASWRVGYERANANLISATSQSTIRENLSAYQTDMYQIGLANNDYDSDFGFDKGWKIGFNAAVGQKRIIQNPNIDQDFYDTIKIKTNIFNLGWRGKYQITLIKQLALHHEVSTGFIFNDQVLNNEMYRIGGLTSLRGFNENFYFASRHALSRLELRQYFERQSYFMLIYDQLIYKNNFQSDNPYGLGVGFTLASTNSLFNFVVAIGNSKDTSLDFSNAKIHFGYTSQF